MCPRRSTCLNRLPPASGVAQQMPGGGAEVDDSHDTAARRLEVDISRRERVDKNTHSHSHRMDRRSGGGEGSLCGHWSTRRFSRCPTLNPRLRCSAPARPPGTPPLPRCPPPQEAIPPPSLSSPTPEHPALLLSQLLPGTRGGRLESCCIWGIARSNIRATGDGENGGDEARTRTGTNDRPLLYDCPTPHSEQHRQGKEHAISGHLGSLCWARSLPRIAIGFPLSGPAITASACCGFGHWRPSPLARMPSLSRPIIMQDTHPRVVL